MKITPERIREIKRRLIGEHGGDWCEIPMGELLAEREEREVMIERLEVRIQRLEAQEIESKGKLASYKRLIFEIQGDPSVGYLMPGTQSRIAAAARGVLPKSELEARVKSAESANAALREENERLKKEADKEHALAVKMADKLRLERTRADALEKKLEKVRGKAERVRKWQAQYGKYHNRVTLGCQCRWCKLERLIGHAILDTGKDPQ